MDQGRQSLGSRQTFFVTLAQVHPRAGQAPKPWIDRLEGEFLYGVGRYRVRLSSSALRSLEFLIPPYCKVTASPKEIPAWDLLTPDQRTVEARLKLRSCGFHVSTDFEIVLVHFAAIRDTSIFITRLSSLTPRYGASLEGWSHGRPTPWPRSMGLPVH